MAEVTVVGGDNGRSAYNTILILMFRKKLYGFSKTILFLFSARRHVLLQNIESVYIPLPSLREGDGSYVIETNKVTLRNYLNSILKNKTVLRGRSPLTLDDIYLDAGFQPEVETDFPYEDRKVPRIPHIIHQIWLSSPDESSVPTAFLENVQKFLNNNPAWTYFFWNNATAREFLGERYPTLLGFYDRLPRIVSKGDMLRYVVLHEFGGVYVDFDVVNHRPLDRITMKYPCILTPEPFEHAVLWYNQPYVVINAIMMCRAKHPFLKQVVDALLSRDFIDNEVQSLGPGFLTVQYRVYSNLSDCRTWIDLSHNSTTPYFYKGSVPATHDDGIYIPNTRYFMDSPSPALKPQVDKTCSSSDISNLARRMCVTVQKRGYFRSPGKYTYLDHLWKHTWSASKRDDEYTYTSVRDLASHFKCYSDLQHSKAKMTS